MINEVIGLRSIELFGALMKDETPLNATAATVGKNHYVLIGANHGKYVLWEKIPAPLVVIGKVHEVDLKTVGLHHVADDEGRAGCQLVTGQLPDIPPVVTEASEEVAAKAAKRSKECMSIALRGVAIPFDPIDDLKPMAGIDGGTDATVEMSDEVSYEVGEVRHVLGSGVKTCRFDVPVAALRLVGRKDVSKITISLDKPNVLNFNCSGEFGMFMPVKAFESLRPQDVKGALDELKQSLADFEECHKGNVVALKGSLASQEACLRDFKKVFNEGVRIVAKLANEAGDPKQVERLETQLSRARGDLKAANEKATGLQKELKAFDKLKTAMAAVASAQDVS